MIIYRLVQLKSKNKYCPTWPKALTLFLSKHIHIRIMSRLMSCIYEALGIKTHSTLQGIQRHTVYIRLYMIITLMCQWIAHLIHNLKILLIGRGISIGPNNMSTTLLFLTCLTINEACVHYSTPHDEKQVCNIKYTQRCK